MTVMQETETIVVERVINASPETIFDFWTDSEKIKIWLASDARLDPRPDGEAYLQMGGHVAKGPFTNNGHFLVVEPHSHLEFTWGFEEPIVGVPPESSVVSVDLIPQDEGTLVRVTHTGLPAGRDSSPFSERVGWTSMLEHLEEAAVA
jgi:uncharacterized protein YndB with AHSA1/START domain